MLDKSSYYNDRICDFHCILSLTPKSELLPTLSQTLEGIVSFKKNLQIYILNLGVQTDNFKPFEIQKASLQNHTPCIKFRSLYICLN